VPYRIGLTGNIATGKSTVGHMLVELGAELIDGDVLAHRVIQPEGPAYAEVVRAFGADILSADQTIDRRRLAAMVFSDPAALRLLEGLIHPPVLAETQRLIAASPAPVVVVEAIKLLESGMAKGYEAIWVTTCPERLQLSRLMRTRHLARADALQRIRAQAPQAEKIARAQVVIDTSGSLQRTRAQVKAAWRAIPLLHQEQ
jgi:dephospho-CoA kinase